MIKTPPTVNWTMYVAVEEISPLGQMQNKELDFLFAARIKRRGRMIKTFKKAVLSV